MPILGGKDGAHAGLGANSNLGVNAGFGVGAGLKVGAGLGADTGLKGNAGLGAKLGFRSDAIRWEGLELMHMEQFLILESVLFLEPLLV
ncbi:hypothetical protein NPIL_421971 [Nephila pilipes]|uniref:Uncharacterized protein n=1 Tax=Nephila pilipes TaxID=299642 RepID=A0A8X6IHW4_NEPPI|nr:hypothetical protein NPIL_421971 [Nephila pilipes]